VLSLAITSCSVQNKIAVNNNITGNEQSFYWLIEIKVQQCNVNVYNVLTVLGKIPYGESFNPLSYLPGESKQGTIVCYITATNSQMLELRESLFEEGVVSVKINKINPN
jgi:hypothetical protein